MEGPSATHLPPEEYTFSSTETSPCESEAHFDTGRIKNWALSLSREALCEALIIRDDAFVSLLLKLHSSPLSTREENQKDSTTATESSPSSLYPLDEVDAIYRRVVNELNNISAMPTVVVVGTTIESSSIDEMTPTARMDSVIPTSTKSSPTTDAVGNGQSSRKKTSSKETNISETNDETIYTDVFDIQDESYRIRTLETHTNLLFPSVIDFILKQQGCSALSNKSSSIPLLAFDSSRVDVHSLSNRLHRCLHEYNMFSCSLLGNFWTYWLRQRFCDANNVSISDLLLARAEVALVETYKAQLAAAGKEDQGNAANSQKSMNTVPEGATRDANNAIQICPIPPSGSKAGLCKSILKDIITFSQELRQFAKLEDLQKLKTICPGIVNSKDQLPFVPLMELMKASECKGEVTKQCRDLNEMLENVLSSVVSRAEKSGFKHQFSAVMNKADVDLGQPVIDPSKKKKKKNNRLKKRKSSNADNVTANDSDPLFLDTDEVENDSEIVESTSAEGGIIVNDSNVGRMADNEAPTLDVDRTALAPNNIDMENSCQLSDRKSVDLSVAISIEMSLKSPVFDNASSVADTKVLTHLTLETSGNNAVESAHSQTDSPTNENDDKIDADLVDIDVNQEEEVWETVETKAKGRRRQIEQKSGTATNNIQLGPRRAKNMRTGVNRKRTQNRKMVKDILLTVLDAVDDEVKRRERRLVAANSLAEERRPLSAEASLNLERRTETITKHSQTANVKPATLRDVVIGRQSLVPLATSKPSQIVAADVTPVRMNESKSAKMVKQHLNCSADQNTAHTAPETLSGTSANTQWSINNDSDTSAFEAHQQPRPAVEQPTTGDSSSDEIEEDKLRRPKPDPVVEKEGYPSPPLQTLLGPGITNSATSSVASSLDASQASNHRHHHHTVGNENDVGYHLLDVCDRLSKDMDVFMARRSAALFARRKERGALLSALQETVYGIWPRRAHVEMYGSCATQLDLPSSDLDAVIRGLDRPEIVTSQAQNQQGRRTPTQSPKRNKQLRRIPGNSSYHEELNFQSDATLRQEMQLSPYSRILPSTVNGDRVLRLATELERQPWAVQVKAIPTASVPVIKILADPSRLPGAMLPTVGGEWIMQHHHLASKTPPVSRINSSSSAPDGQPFIPANSSSVSNSQIQYPHSPPWRGADVMNGLFSVDITFEGPEHGGIGSTAFSARVVQDACNETGLPPERTPAVQVLMVLKELLAQRRLNEPFSGGLSSYALLLLVVAVLKERNAIRDEMERIERHRRGLVNGSVPASSQNSYHSAVRGKCESKLADKSESKCLQQSKKEENGSSAMKETTSRLEPKTVSAQAKVDNVGGIEEKKVLHEDQLKLRLMATKGAETSAMKETPIQPTPLVKGGASSWASIARKNTASVPAPTQVKAQIADPSVPMNTTASASKSVKKVSSFAEAVSGKQTASSTPTPKMLSMEATMPKQAPVAKRNDKPLSNNLPPKAGSQKQDAPKKANPTSPYQEKVLSNTRSSLLDAPFLPLTEPVSESPHLHFSSSDCSLPGRFSMFPQGSDDVLEVLCSGETTAGKLLMHFLLFYGRYFDSRSTAIEVSGRHHQDMQNPYLSPYIPRRSGGTIDPHTGMLTVDPLVVFDPWEGADNNNVARSCFAWNSIRWHFAQCYMTLSSAVERNRTPPTDSISAAAPVLKTERTGDNDVVSPLLELLLSF